LVKPTHIFLYKKLTEHRIGSSSLLLGKTRPCDPLLK
jgi:hypothetical protein